MTFKNIKELKDEIRKKEYAPQDAKQVKLYENTIDLIIMEAKILALENVVKKIDECVFLNPYQKLKLKAIIKGK